MTWRPDARRDNESRPFRVMPWWLVAAGLAVSLLLGWLVTGLLLDEASAGTTEAGLRIDAIRIGLTVVAGSGGAMALVFAARRQWLNERTQQHHERASAADRAHAEAVHDHNQRVHAATQEAAERSRLDTERDATERRITELYAMAVDQLGSERATVQLGGIYALERLADSYSAQRQMIVNVLCGFLAEPGEEKSGHPRRAAQQVLVRHLCDSAARWDGLRLNLSGAVLDDWDARDAIFDEADFSGAVFRGTTSFVEATFREPVRFTGARFIGEADFRRARFHGSLTFDECGFDDSLGFDEVRADGTVTAVKLRVGGATSWRHGDFAGSVDCDSAGFHGDADFSDTRFADTLSARHLTFEAAAAFGGTGFGGITHFQGTRFRGDTDFERARFGDSAAFNICRFHGSVRFGDCRRSGTMWFQSVHLFGQAIREWPPGCFEEPKGSHLVLRTGSPDGSLPA